MENLEDNFDRNISSAEMVYANMVNNLFFEALNQDDEEKMKILIYPGSPVLSVKATVPFGGTGSFLHCLSCSTKPNIVIAQLLIDFGIKIDHQDENGDTALHLNADKYHTHNEQNHINFIKVLLKNGANIDIRNKQGLTPIQVGLVAGDLDVVEEFLKEEDKLPNTTKLDKTQRSRHLVKCLLRDGNNCNVLSTNYSVILHFLMLQNDEATFEFVATNSKFDVTAVLRECTLLNVLTIKGTSRMITVLVNLGADLDAACSFCGETPLITAIQNTRMEMVDFLLARGVSVNKNLAYPCITPGLSHYRKFLQRLQDKSPLYFAICTQNFEIVEKLLKMGANVNALTNGYSTLLIACTSMSTRPFFEPFEEYFAFRMTKTIDDIDKKELSIKIVEILLEYGVDIETKDTSERTALDQACKSGNLDIVKLLFSRGAKIHQGDVSTLHYAIRGENLDIIKLVLEKGADVNYRCAPKASLSRVIYSGSLGVPLVTPLECAIYMIEKDDICKNVLEVLLEYGANVNITDLVLRESPLSIACASIKKYAHLLPSKIKSSAATIKLLLQYNANVNACGLRGLLPLDYVIRNYKSWIQKKLGNFIPNEFKPDLVALIAFIAIKIENKESVIEENLALLEDEFARPILEECKNELSLMKRNIYESHNFSFFDVLFKRIQTVGSALQNKDLLDVLNTGEYKKNFPIYADYLEHRIRKATNIQRLVDLAIFLFQKHISEIILGEVTLAIFKFLDLHDVKNFTKACFVNLE